ncbi:MAG: hypothetical protein ACK5LG_22165 [Bacteroides thetaiotaomicron]
MFKKDDVVHHNRFKISGTVSEDQHVNDQYIRVRINDPAKNCLREVEWIPTNCQLVSASTAAAAPYAGSKGTYANPFVVGDMVKVVITGTSITDMVGKVVKTDYPYTPVIHVEFADGSVHTLDQSDCKLAEDVFTTALGHYQAIASIPEPEKKPFDHDQLGTDLSGDDLMKSIRDICGR